MTLTPQRRTTDLLPWWKNPAWVSIVSALLLNAVLAFFQYGRLTQRVDDLSDQVKELRQTIITQHRSP